LTYVLEGIVIFLVGFVLYLLAALSGSRARRVRAEEAAEFWFEGWSELYRGLKNG
jgi:hypothetical protein